MDDIRERFATLHEIVAAARSRLDRIAWDYLVGGSTTETTLQRNRLGFDGLAFRPRVLRNVARVDIGGEVFGRPIAMPVALAPVGSLQSFDPGAIPAAAAAAQAANVPIICSGIHPAALDDMAGGTSGPKVFQPYLSGNHPKLPLLVERARETGCDAFCLTVDSAHPGRRERDLANRYAKPYAQGSGDRPDTLTWDDVKRYKDLTDLPLVLKGLATGEDAAIAADHGVDVVYVSNHGGRQLDHGRGAIEVLPEVVAAVAGRSRVWFDGGVSRGSDVVKARILGADLVGIGRLYCYGLAAAGEAGVVRVLELLAEEVQEVLALLGATSFAQLDPSYLCAASPVPWRGRDPAFPLLDPAGRNQV